ncbi:MAG: hypothetical protein KKH77_07535 [Candidatus Omnitrophica bacterium]|nr:hypothetical protein [Candidatus Omnitrophota bacterium]MBU1808653.1 hypothetical protein [Candidatus Omnitrophota bacterium]
MKNAFRYISIALVVLFIGFALSSGLLHDSLTKVTAGVTAEFTNDITRHCKTLWVYSFQKSRWHYFLLPEGAYTSAFYTTQLSLSTVVNIISNSMFNALFQPLFFCAFTPQTVFNCLLFPFFLYGAIIYFKKVPIMVLVCLGLYAYIGIYSSVVEPIIRHRMSCELIYLLIGLAGFINLITERSSS